jgi:2-hydroxy-3-keto-5-methylthiopentenyl-1-phosphate phosphatase
MSNHFNKVPKKELQSQLNDIIQEVPRVLVKKELQRNNQIYFLDIEYQNSQKWKVKKSEDNNCVALCSQLSSLYT